MMIELKTVETDINSLRREMDSYYQSMQNFSTGDPRENLMQLSAFSARMSAVRSHIIRNGDGKAEANFRTKELDPFIAECDRQFKIWSRLITYSQHEFEMARGF